MTANDTDFPANDTARSCAKVCEVYSRVCGYYRPVVNWNVGKQEEFGDRLEYVYGAGRLQGDGQKVG